MTILAEIPHNGQLLKVRVIDAITTGDGRKLAVIQAMSGKPFTSYTMGGPADSDVTNIPTCALRNVQAVSDPQPQPARPNLLTLALAYQAKGQWASGETVTLAAGKTGNPLAWLKNNGGQVWLHAIGAPRGLLFSLLGRNGWEVSRTLQADYPTWAQAAQANRSK